MDLLLEITRKEVILLASAEFNRLSNMFYKAKKERRKFITDHNKHSKHKGSFYSKRERLNENYVKACIELAIYAGVPDYCIVKMSGDVLSLDNISIEKAGYGDAFSIFYNYTGKSAKGNGHAHLVLDKQGNISYHRGINQPHGKHNFTSRHNFGPSLLPVS